MVVLVVVGGGSGNDSGRGSGGSSDGGSGGGSGGGTVGSTGGSTKPFKILIFTRNLQLKLDVTSSVTYLLILNCLDMIPKNCKYNMISV